MGVAAFARRGSRDHELLAKADHASKRSFMRHLRSAPFCARLDGAGRDRAVDSVRF